LQPRRPRPHFGSSPHLKVTKFIAHGIERGQTAKWEARFLAVQWVNPAACCRTMLHQPPATALHMPMHRWSGMPATWSWRCRPPPRRPPRPFQRYG